MARGCAWFGLLGPDIVQEMEHTIIIRCKRRRWRLRATVLLLPSVLPPPSRHPGTGKSHFASKLESAMSHKYQRIIQDSLGTRRKCETLACKILSDGKKAAIIDRCNFDADQRKTWMEIANKFEVHCECIVFDYPTDVCIVRCRRRMGHETIHPSKAAAVVALVKRQYRPPVLRGRKGNKNSNAAAGGAGVMQCAGGEQFHRIEHVSSFNMADSLAERYLRRL